MSKPNILQYDEVRDVIEKRRCHLLLGNGFSIACDSQFSYGSLYDYACGNGLSDYVKGVFDHIGTNNFEGVLRLLRDGHWIAHHYGYRKPKDSIASMSNDMKAVKEALICAVAKTHPPFPSDVGEEKMEICADFLAPYFNIFTLNYDLLLYWVAMRRIKNLMRRDGFGNSLDDPGAPFCVFQEHVGGREGIFFIHGALHLFVMDGEVRKHTWSKTGISLIDMITMSLKQEQYPLFVAEGHAQKKKVQIQGDSYLSYCLGKFHRVQGPIVVFGLSLGESDQHIIESIVYNVNVEQMFVGLFGDPGSSVNRKIIQVCTKMKRDRDLICGEIGKGNKLFISYYDSASAPVWCK